MSFLNCKDCKNCEEREKHLSEKMQDLLGDLGAAKVFGQRMALLDLKKLFNAYIDCYLDKLLKEEKNG